MNARGFTLIEVLFTLLIFSIGLLAVAGLQTISKKANYDALQRTTASMLANDIIERMRANARMLEEYILPVGGELGGATLSAPAVLCTAASCNTNGVTPLANPTVHACGSTSALYGDNNEYRRILTITTYITPTT